MGNAERTLTIASVSTMTKKKLQKRRDRDVLWVTQAQWSDATWGPYSEMGVASSRADAMLRASNYITVNSISWAKGNRTQYGFSRRIRFRKYGLLP